MHHSTSNKNRKTLAITGPAKSNVQNGLRMLVRKRVCVASWGSHYYSIESTQDPRILQNIHHLDLAGLFGLSCH